MYKDKLGRVILDEADLIKLLYQQDVKILKNLLVEDSIRVNFNDSVIKNGDQIDQIKEYQQEDLELFDEANQVTLFMPDNYCPNLVDWLYEQCQTTEQKQRIDLELKLFIQHNMFDLLFYLKYLVDTMRSNNILWGVGRGSSVASYVLFLIGIHKIDSLKYDLDIHEFLK